MVASLIRTHLPRRSLPKASMRTPSRPGLSTRRCSWSRARTRRALSLISSRIRTLPSALPSSRSSMAPSQPEDTIGHIWTQLDSAERPSPRLVPVVLGCARGSAAGSPHVVTCGYMWLHVVTRQRAPLRLPGHTPPQCSAMVFRKRGKAEGVLGPWRHGGGGGRLCGAEKGTAAGPLAIACAADPMP